MIVCFKCAKEMRCELNGLNCHYGYGHVYREVICFVARSAIPKSFIQMVHQITLTSM